MSGEALKRCEDEQECGQPCPPPLACDECASYWQRMRVEGFWKDSTGWTQKGWKEIVRHA